MKRILLLLFLLWGTLFPTFATPLSSPLEVNPNLLNGEERQLLDEAEQYVKKESYKSAASRFHKLSQRETLDRRSKAMFAHLSAECWLLAGKLDKSREAYQQLLREYPLYLSYDAIVPQLRKMAELYAEGDGTFLGVREKDTAIKVYEMLLQEAPSIMVSLQDRQRLAELQEITEEYADAVDTYQQILKLAPNDYKSRLHLAKLLVKISKRGDGDGARLRTAQRHLNIILKENPTSEERSEVTALLAECQETEAQRLLDLGCFYLERIGNRPKAARQYLQELVTLYPGTKAAMQGQAILKDLESKTAFSEEKK